MYAPITTASVCAALRRLVNEHGTPNNFYVLELADYVGTNPMILGKVLRYNLPHITAQLGIPLRYNPNTSNGRRAHVSA